MTRFALGVDNVTATEVIATFNWVCAVVTLVKYFGKLNDTLAATILLDLVTGLFLLIGVSKKSDGMLRCGLACTMLKAILAVNRFGCLVYFATQGLVMGNLLLMFGIASVGLIWFCFIINGARKDIAAELAAGTQPATMTVTLAIPPNFTKECPPPTAPFLV